MKTLLITFLGCFFLLPSFAQSDTEQDSLLLQKSKNTEILIRCQASIRNYDSPLFIVDGVSLTSSDAAFKDLKPENIVSIEVIKIPPAIFCYGSAKNGVVLITTKASSQAVVLEKDPPFKVYKICNDNWNTTQEVYNAIQATVPNITISSNANARSTPSIRMRGDDTTIVIVDGIRYDVSILNTLNPADIESVKVSNSIAAQNYYLIR